MKLSHETFLASYAFELHRNEIISSNIDIIDSCMLSLGECREGGGD